VSFHGNVVLGAGDTSTLFLGNVTLDAGASGMSLTSAHDIRFGSNSASNDLTLKGPGSVSIITNGSGSSLEVTARVDGATNLILNTSESATFSGAVGGMTPLGTGTGAALLIESAFPAVTTFDQTVQTNSGIVQQTSAGPITFQGNVTLGALGTDTDSDFHENVNLAGITLTSAGNLTFGDAPASDRLTLSTGAVVIDTSAANKNVVFDARIDGAQSLTVNSGNGTTTFAGAIGSIQPLTNLTTDALGLTQINTGSITTTANQTFNDPVTLGASSVLAGVNVTFGSSLDDDGNLSTPSGLTVNATGVARFGGAVGSGSPLDSITTDITPGSESTSLNGNITTVGNTVTFNDAVVLTSDVTITDSGATGVTFASTVSGAKNLTLVVTRPTKFQGAVSIGSSLGASLNVNSAGGTTFSSTVQTASGITQAATAGLMTFNGNVTIAAGNTATTFNGNIVLNGVSMISSRGIVFGATTSNQVTLSGASVTIQTTGLNGTLAFNSKIDGNVNTTITSSVGTTLVAAIGGTTPLNSLALTSNGALTVGQNITTNNSLSLMVPEDPLFLNIDNISITGAVVKSLSGSVTLQAGDNVSVDNASSILAAGAVTIDGDYNDNDANGAVFTLSGAMTGSSVNIVGGPFGDMFNVNAATVNNWVLNGGTGADNYNISATAVTSGTLTIADSGSDAGTDLLTISGGSGANSFVTTATQTIFNGTGTVNYNSNLEQLSLVGGGVADSFDVTPSTTMPITIAGGAPSTAPGDVLTYHGAGSASAVPDGVVTLAGFANVTYTGIEGVTPIVNAGTDVNLTAGNSLNFNGSFSDPDAGPWTATVNYGNGSGTLPLALGAGNSFTLSDIYNTAGTYTATVSVTNSNDLIVGTSSFHVVVTGVAAPPPDVTGLFVSSTQWDPEFLSHAPMTTGLGYEIPTNSGQLLDLPWINLNEVSIQFSENVNVAEADLVLASTSLGSYGFQSFSYNATNDTATWILTQTIAADKLLVDLAGSGSSPVTSVSSGLTLDGDWTDSSGATHSGNGVAGGDFTFHFNVLPGDVNQDGQVKSADVLLVRNAQFTAYPNAGYSAFYNVNGSGLDPSFHTEILVDDVLDVRNLQFTTLPAGAPPSPVVFPSFVVPGNGNGNDYDNGNGDDAPILVSLVSGSSVTDTTSTVPVDPPAPDGSSSDGGSSDPGSTDGSGLDVAAAATGADDTSDSGTATAASDGSDTTAVVSAPVATVTAASPTDGSGDDTSVVQATVDSIADSSAVAAAAPLVVSDNTAAPIAAPAATAAASYAAPAPSQNSAPLAANVASAIGLPAVSGSQDAGDAAASPVAAEQAVSLAPAQDSTAAPLDLAMNSVPTAALNLVFPTAAGSLPAQSTTAGGAPSPAADEDPVSPELIVEPTFNVIPPAIGEAVVSSNSAGVSQQPAMTVNMQRTSATEENESLVPSLPIFGLAAAPIAVLPDEDSDHVSLPWAAFSNVYGNLGASGYSALVGPLGSDVDEFGIADSFSDVEMLKAIDQALSPVAIRPHESERDAAVDDLEAFDRVAGLQGFVEDSETA
jgi:hypothetical protein